MKKSSRRDRKLEREFDPTKVAKDFKQKCDIDTSFLQEKQSLVAGRAEDQIGSYTCNKILDKKSELQEVKRKEGDEFMMEAEARRNLTTDQAKEEGGVQTTQV